MLMLHNACQQGRVYESSQLAGDTGWLCYALDYKK
tara:strand:- start:90 stop:194 length:105 start_codon:yes stop_codon:yes gene_type:complete